MKILGVIPARYGSGRFPGKALADIHGKPMVAWVYAAAKQARRLAGVVVATDHPAIFAECNKRGIPVAMTKPEHATGTDRVAEVALTSDADGFVNIQGDEPMLDAAAVDDIAFSLADDPAHVQNACAAITDPADVLNADVVKVVTTAKHRAIFFSRAPIPYPRARLAPYLRQIGLYAFTRTDLLRFADLGPGALELTEGIEMMRCIEHGIAVRMRFAAKTGIAVDTPADLERVRRELA